MSNDVSINMQPGSDKLSVNNALNEVNPRIVDSSYVINMNADIDRLKEFNDMMGDSWPFIRHPAINGKVLMSNHDTRDLLEIQQDSSIKSPICPSNLQPELVHDKNQKVPTSEALLLEKQWALKKKYVRNLTWLNPSEIGCLLSHVTLWEIVANDPDKNRIAIFEDDARSHVDTTTVLCTVSNFYKYLEQSGIPEPDMLYLGKALDDCMSYEKVWNNVYKSRHPLCLHAYIITKTGARKLLSMAPYIVAIDMVPVKAIEQNLITAMAFHPSIYFQDIFNTTSNLRNIRSAINITTECLVTQQHITGDTWHYTAIIIIGIIAALILFISFIWV
ncbi:Glycosyltransferase family 25 (LPS biosynthesis protein) [uncultured virus]|nr:Glycosyltransferase family 25 (LPS biosynthesis protein) [uncultured virus]